MIMTTIKTIAKVIVTTNFPNYKQTTFKCYKSSTFKTIIFRLIKTEQI